MANADERRAKRRSRACPADFPVKPYAAAPFMASRPISRTMYCWRLDTGNDSSMPCSSTSQCASPSSFARRSKPRMKSRATSQRFLEQVLALCSTNRDVLEFRFEIDHLVDGDEHDA